LSDEIDTRLSQIKDTAKEDPYEAQEMLANLCEEFTDEELAELWDTQSHNVSFLRKRLGIVKSRGGGVKALEKPSHYLSSAPTCSNTTFEFNFKFEGSYSGDRLQSQLTSISELVNPDERYEVSIEIKEK